MRLPSMSNSHIAQLLHDHKKEQKKNKKGKENTIVPVNNLI